MSSKNLRHLHLLMSDLFVVSIQKTPQDILGALTTIIMNLLEREYVKVWSQFNDVSYFDFTSIFHWFYSLFWFVSKKKKFHLEIILQFNPWTPESDQLLISPYNWILNHTLKSQEDRKWSSTKKLLIVKQILLVSTSGNVQRAEWRICILKLGWKELKDI